MADKPLSARAAPLNKADENLLDFFKNLESQSLDTLDNAARQIINLVTTLLGLFFGVLAFKDNPDYFASGALKGLAAAAAGLYIVALFFALDVVMPRRVDIPGADLTQMRRLLRGLFDRKNRSLLGAQAAFGLGTFCLLGIILFLLFRL